MIGAGYTDTRIITLGLRFDTKSSLGLLHIVSCSGVSPYYILQQGLGSDCFELMIILS